ncbi:transcriptional regulator [Pseudoroseomonas cervicalis]|uniref:transcriptional regulator n=1 Tax=Teichococcus cervicalis TaxID=204525 RepID=UPI00058C4C78
MADIDLKSRLRAGVEAAVKAAGSNAALAGHLGLSRTAPHKWRRIPAEHVAAISRLTGIPCHQLRPDVFAEPFADGRAA